MSHPLDFQSRSLLQQGYSNLSASQLKQLQWGLRFTPTVCMLAAAYGLVTHNAPLLVALAVLGIAPFWFPAWHPVDRLYNHVVAPLIGAIRLPPNPFPRRIACVSAGVCNIAAAAFLARGQVTAAYAVGGLLLVLQVIVNTTHFCLASFFIELGLKAMGVALPTERLCPQRARALIAEGARLVDVRDVSEFELGSLPGAENLPLEAIGDEAEALASANTPLILFCQGGGRSRMAASLLARRGVTQLHDLGAMERWGEV